MSKKLNGAAARSLKLDSKKVEEIRSKHAAGTPRKALAELYGVSVPNIRDIVIGEIWRDTGGPRVPILNLKYSDKMKEFYDQAIPVYLQYGDNLKLRQLHWKGVVEFKRKARILHKIKYEIARRAKIEEYRYD